MSNPNRYFLGCRVPDYLYNYFFPKKIEELKEKLILSAIKLSDECVVVKLQSKDKMNKSRHCFIIKDIVVCGIKPPINGEQGFLTSTGRFVSREEGKEIALASGQIKSTFSGTLCSEDLW